MKSIKLLAAGIAAITAISAMSVSVFASSDTDSILNNSETMQIDYSIYDADLEYIPEHAKIIEEYNENMKKTRATSYSAWSWSSGIFSYTTGKSSGFVVPFYFTPTSNYLYFNVEVTGGSTTPYLTVNTYKSDGSLGYIGSYNIKSSGSNSYEWSNQKRPLNAGTKYVFALLNNSNWSSSSIDINKTSF